MKILRTLKTNRMAFVFVKCTFRNTLITITNENQEPLFQRSSRGYPTKLKRKNNPYILQKVMLQVVTFLKKLKYRHLYIFINGVGAGRYNILKHLVKRFKIIVIQDKTRVPFNGCRLPKPKRK